MPVKDVDPIVRVLWQHDGARFRVRSVFESGAVSGVSALLEPGTILSYGGKVVRKAAGEGIYVAPGFDTLMLAVGPDAIARLARLVENTCGDREVKRFMVHDLRMRSCLMVHVASGRSCKVTPCSNPQFLPEGWEGTKCVD
jgi:hypothetical protein